MGYKAVMNLYDMNIAEYMACAVKLDLILAAIDRELEFKGAGYLLAEVLGCQSGSDGNFWDDQVAMFLSRWQKLAQEGPRNDGYIQNFTSECVAFYREKYADLMQSFFAERAEDYFDETDNDLFYYAISSIAYESAYLDFGALGHVHKDCYQKATEKHDYLAQSDLYERLATIGTQITDLLPQLSQTIDDYHATFNAISDFDGEIEDMRILASHWEDYLKEAMKTVQCIQAELLAVGNK